MKKQDWQELYRTMRRLHHNPFVADHGPELSTWGFDNSELAQRQYLQDTLDMVTGGATHVHVIVSVGGVEGTWEQHHMVPAKALMVEHHLRKANDYFDGPFSVSFN